LIIFIQDFFFLRILVEERKNTIFATSNLI